MADQTTPRRMVKAWLRGEPLPRPLLMPILFSLGARLENLSPRDFQSNPTKIANSLRQIRAFLKVDGLAAYFNPYLEAEALGCARIWKDDGSAALRPPEFSSPHELHAMSDPGSVGDHPLVRTGCDVLQRARAMLKDEPALMVRVTGPITLACQLLGKSAADDLSPPLPEIVEFAVEVTASMARIFVESGADVLLLAEDVLPSMSPEHCAWWASLLAPVINVVRFYEALPVLLLGPAASSQEHLDAILHRSWECVLCPSVNDLQSLRRLPSQSLGNSLGLALPADIFSRTPDAFRSLMESLHEHMSSPGLVMLTSSGDMASTLEMKHLAGTIGSLREAFASAKSGG